MTRKKDKWDHWLCQFLEAKYRSWQLAANKFTLGNDWLIWLIDGQCASGEGLESVTEIAELVITDREGEADKESEGGFVFSKSAAYDSVEDDVPAKRPFS